MILITLITTISMCIHIYIYIYIYRERERYTCFSKYVCSAGGSLRQPACPGIAVPMAAAIWEITSIVLSAYQLIRICVLTCLYYC